MLKELVEKSRRLKTLAYFLNSEKRIKAKGPSLKVIGKELPSEPVNLGMSLTPLRQFGKRLGNTL